MKDNRWEKLQNIIPKTAEDDIQILFTGSSGKVLLKQSIDFVRHFYCETLTHIIVPGILNNLEEIKILDYGCGWGRLLRLLPCYFNYRNILGVDPWDFALMQCKNSGVLCPTKKIKRDASDLDNIGYDAGYAFSVFTHLPNNIMLKILSNISKCFADKGIFLITIRPPEYWNFVIDSRHDKRKDMYLKAIKEHYENGFAFVSHDGKLDNYGDSSMTLEWIESNIKEWKIINIERSMGDSLQICVTLQKS